MVPKTPLPADYPPTPPIRLPFLGHILYMLPLHLGPYIRDVVLGG